MTSVRRPIGDRFWPKVDRSGGPDACWPWVGYRNPMGYGQLGSGGHRGTILAHRAAYVLVVGPIPDGSSVCHRCDNPPCVNPAHLFIGTQKDNANDRDAKGRNKPGPGAPPPHYSGERNPAAKLSAVAVAAIRTSHRSISAQARELGVSRATIRRARNGETWAFGK